MVTIDAVQKRLQCRGAESDSAKVPIDSSGEHDFLRERVALYALSTAGTTRLLVRSRGHQLPEGVLTDFDLAAAAGR